MNLKKTEMARRSEGLSPWRFWCLFPVLWGALQAAGRAVRTEGTVGGPGARWVRGAGRGAGCSVGHRSPANEGISVDQQVDVPKAYCIQSGTSPHGECGTAWKSLSVGIIFFKAPTSGPWAPELSDRGRALGGQMIAVLWTRRRVGPGAGELWPRWALRMKRRR